MFKSLKSVLAALLITAAGSASATTTQVLSFTGDTTIDFNGLAAGDAVTDTFASQGVTFSGNVGSRSNGFKAFGQNSFFGNRGDANDIGLGFYFGPNSVLFSQDVARVGFDFISNIGYNVDVEVLRDNVVLNTFNIVQAAPAGSFSTRVPEPNFQGFANTAGIDELRFTFNNGGTHLIDNLTFNAATPVPLPAAGWMLVAGVGGMIAMRRKKRS